MSEQDQTNVGNAGEAAANTGGSKQSQTLDLSFDSKASSNAGNQDVNPDSSKGNSKAETRIQELINKGKEAQAKHDEEMKTANAKFEESNKGFEALKKDVEPYQNFYKANADKVKNYDQLTASDPKLITKFFEMANGQDVNSGQANQNGNDDELPPEERLEKQMLAQKEYFDKQMAGLTDQLKSNVSAQETTQYKQDMGEVLKGLIKNNPDIDEVRAAKHIDNELRAGRGDFHNPQDMYKLGKEFQQSEVALEAKFKAKWVAEQKTKDETQDDIPPVHGNSGFSQSSQGLPKDLDLGQFKSDGEGYGGNFGERVRKAMKLL